jgi:heme exporter protein CcmD
MTWGSWSAFWSMGGHPGFVWGAYGVTVAVLGAELVLLRARRQRALAEAAAASTDSATTRAPR